MQIHRLQNTCSVSYYSTVNLEGSEGRLLWCLGYFSLQDQWHVTVALLTCNGIKSGCMLFVVLFKVYAYTCNSGSGKGGVHLMTLSFTFVALPQQEKTIKKKAKLATKKLHSEPMTNLICRWWSIAYLTL